MQQQYVVGIDLGGTKIAMALAGTEGHILASTRQPTNVSGGRRRYCPPWLIWWANF